MITSPPYRPVDYLLVGHVTADLTPEGIVAGGTVVYAGLTARALGLRVGIVTAWGPEFPLEVLDGVQIAGFPSEQSTTFENIPTATGRTQRLLHVTTGLDYHLIPEPWRSTAIVHLAPVAQEVEPSIVRYISPQLLGVTPQGWLRAWDDQGIVRPTEWPEASFVLSNVDAAVLSLDDLGGDPQRLQELTAACRILAVTEAERGASLYWNGEVRQSTPARSRPEERTGAGDIFAALFFTRLHRVGDPWEATSFATQLTTQSTQRPGLAGVPTPTEIEKWEAEMIR